MYTIDGVKKRGLIVEKPIIYTQKKKKKVEKHICSLKTPPFRLYDTYRSNILCESQSCQAPAHQKKKRLINSHNSATSELFFFCAKTYTTEGQIYICILLSLQKKKKGKKNVAFAAQTASYFWGSFSVKSPPPLIVVLQILLSVLLPFHFCLF